ncbi:hypothetical protein SLA2020_355630 [Shorea laevis]
MITPGIGPNCLTVAGIAMILAPKIVLGRLNTAPENDGPSKEDSCASNNSSCFLERKGNAGTPSVFWVQRGQIWVR